MSLTKTLRESQALTERETDIRNYLLEHPENVMGMSCQDLGRATFTSAATVTRFCKKFDCKGYPEFKLRFLSELRAGQDQDEAVQLSERENKESPSAEVTKRISEIPAVIKAIAVPFICAVIISLFGAQYYAYAGLPGLLTTVNASAPLTPTP